MILPQIEHENLFKSAQVHAQTVSWNVYASPSHPAASIALQPYKCPSDWRSLLAADSEAPFVIGYTSYVGVSGTSGASRRSFGPGGPQDGIFFEDSKVRISSILDGTSNTLMVAERPPANDMILGWWFAGPGWDNGGTGDVILGTYEKTYNTYAAILTSRQHPADWFPQCDGKFLNYDAGDVFDPCHQLHYWSLHSGITNFCLADGSVRSIAFGVDQTTIRSLSTRSGGEAVSID